MLLMLYIMGRGICPLPMSDDYLQVVQEAAYAGR